MDYKEKIDSLVGNIEKIFLGKTKTVKLCIAGVLARGHILIEDVPGIGKTTLAQAIAKSMNCKFNRIQFTSDMLPSDILGVSVLNPQKADFEFRRGPIFANVVLADEINRTPPKTQSALLEAMSEYQISMDGQTYQLPKPFVVIATQNPIEYEGTYSLPESQLDRFLLRLDIGYPPSEEEMLIMRRGDVFKEINELSPVISAEEIIELQEHVRKITVEDSVTFYMLQIVERTRTHPDVELGLSPRGSQSLYVASQAWAVINGRDYVTPNDVKEMAEPVIAHRLILKSRTFNLSKLAEERRKVVQNIIDNVPLPR
ncbi:MAG: MoxR family ATPase [Candidatus Hydrogenedentes bacterium]|nr:MoxR family ATPase [Candidatus Hydrogenedentota bacterium]